MKKRKQINSSYVIHSFMYEKMNLCGSELTVFAVIHSFTKGEKGLFYGTNDFLARACGLSVSTVKRAVARLLNKGYIEEHPSAEHRGYRCTDFIMKNGCEHDEYPSNEAEEYLPSINEINERGLDVRELIAGDEVRPKYVFHPVSKDGLVMMTSEQYARLLNLVPSELLSSYIRRLELMIKNDGYRTFSAYKTIKRWILEDVSTG